MLIQKPFSSGRRQLPLTRSAHKIAACAAMVLASALLFSVPASADAGADLFRGEGQPGGLAHVRKGVSVPAVQLNCGSCHGRDGMGRTEAGRTAPTIQRGAGGLGEPALGSDGQVRPAYDKQLFARLLAVGLNSSGRDVDARMPRYELSDATVDALWTYLNELRVVSRLGVGPNALTFAIVAPPAQAEMLRRRLAAALDPGVTPFGRRLELFVAENSTSGPCLPALAIVMAGPEDREAFLRKAAECSVPVIAPLFEVSGFEDPADIRGVSASLAEQWRALISEAGPDATIEFPPDLQAWEAAALRSAKIEPKRGATDGPIVAPFGLDRLPKREGVPTVFTIAEHSAASLPFWLEAGSEIVIAQTRGDGPGKALDRLTRVVADLIQRASITAGPDPTRARFMEAFDRLRRTQGDWPDLDYRSNDLTGSRVVELRLYRPAGSAGAATTRAR